MQFEAIRPHSFTLDEFFQFSRLSCAQEQRDYQWQPQQTEQLIRDLITHSTQHAGRPYFIGTMVLSGPLRDLAIYDGLQRTTTLLLAMAMLRDRLDDRVLQARLHRCIQVPGGHFRLRLPPSPNGVEPLAERYLPFGATVQLARGGARYGRTLALEHNARAINKLLKTLDQPGLARLADCLLSRVLIVALLVDDPQLAQTVFDRINSTGLRLAPHDLIKSRILQFVSSEAEGAELVKVWDEIRQNVAHDFDEFVGDLLVMHEPDMMALPADRKLDAFMEWARETHARGNGALLRVFRKSVEVAKDWRAINQLAKRGVASRKNLRQLLPIHVLDWYEWRPLAVLYAGAARSRRPGASQLMERRFRQLQQRAMAIHLSRMTDKNRRSVFARAIRSQKSGRNPFSKSLRVGDAARNRIRATLRRSMIDHAMRVQLLRWDHAQGRARIGDIGTVEHVLPQNPPDDSDWLVDFPKFDERHRLVNLIGNFVLVPADVNEALGNGPFPEKRAGLKAARDSLKQFPRALELLAYDSWTPETIEARTDSYGQQLWDQLNLPGQPVFLVPDFEVEPEDDDQDDLAALDEEDDAEDAEGDVPGEDDLVLDGDEDDGGGEDDFSDDGAGEALEADEDYVPGSASVSSGTAP